MTSEQKFRVCPGCGNLTPAERPDCPYCGFSSVELLRAKQEEVKEHHFFQALFTRSNPFTLLLIGINVGVFVLEWLAGGMSAMDADSQTIAAFGAKVNTLIFEQRQYWRFITSMFIHIGFIHLLLNNYALWIIGMEIERIYGSARFVILYFLTGIAGSVASYFFTDANSAGASGAIFGLFGVMATFAFRFRKEIPEALSKDIRRRVIPIIAINVAFGFSVSMVDNAAHLGGLLAGVLLALAIPYKRPQERATPLAFRLFQYLLLAAAFASFLFAFTNYNGPKPSFANLGKKPGDEARIYFENIKAATDSLKEAINLMADILNNKKESASTAPAKDAVERGLRAVNAIPPIDPDANGFKQRLVDLLIEEREIIRQFDESNPKNWSKTIHEENDFNKKYAQFWTDFNPWLTGFLKRHGYELGRGDKDDK